MNIAISAIRTKDVKINRHELITSLQNYGFKVYYIGQKSNDRIHPDYRKYNVEFLSIPIVRSNTNPFLEIKTILNTVKVLKKHNIKKIIVYGIRTFPAIVLASKLAGVNNILCIVNGSGRLFQLQGIKGFLVKFISYPMLWLSFISCNNILFQNPDDLKMIKRKGLLWKKNYGLINGSGVNLKEFKFSDLSKEPKFIMVSRITGTKGVNEYIKAARIVKQKYPESTFHLLGPIDEDDTSIDKILFKEALLDNIIIYKGKVEDVRPYIKQSRIFVLPSYYPEGIPRAILEAMAMGRPIITTNSPGCKETVIDNVNGFLIPPKNAEKLAEKMIWMINNHKKVEQMGKESRKICEKRFDVNKVNKIILKKLTS